MKRSFIQLTTISPPSQIPCYEAVTAWGRNEDRVLYCAKYQTDACQIHDNYEGHLFDSQHCSSIFDLWHLLEEMAESGGVPSVRISPKVFGVAWTG